jgi:hypothetical protein
VLLAVRATEEAWTWAVVVRAMGPAEARASMACPWVAETTALKAAGWTWADMAEVLEAAIPTSTKTLTVVVAEADLISATATAK